MRLVVWNCRDSLHKKFTALSALNFEIAVVPETRLSSLQALDLPNSRSCWIGRDGKLGLAIIVGEGWSVEACPTRCEEELFLPVVCRRGSNQLRLLGVWTQHDSRHSYIGPLERGIAAHAGWLAEGASIIAGDFNASVGWKKEGKQFARLVDQLTERGFTSAWHWGTGEQHGGESQRTVFLTYSEKVQYHIDFAFLPSRPEWRPTSVTLGAYREWVATRLSDHVPLVVDVGG